MALSQLNKPTWQSADGNVRLYHADCRQVLPRECDVVVTDPPYGVNKAEWDSVIPSQYMLELLLKSASVCVWFGTSRPDCVKAVLELTPCPDRVYVWNNTFTLTNSDAAFWQWQPFYVWGHLTGMKSDVVSMAANYRSSGKPLHPCQKPVPLMNKIVSCACEKNKVVLDPFMGSGTTLVAAKQLQRQAIGIELEEKYCEIAADRLRQGVLELY